VLNLNVKYFAVGRVKNEEMYGNSYVRLDSFKLKKNEAILLDIQCIDSLRFELIEGENRSTHAFGQWLVNNRGSFWITRNAANRVLDQGHLNIQIQNPESLARSYIKDLLVKPMSYYSSVLELKLREPIARRAADVLNKLVEVYNQAAAQDKNKVSENTIKFIDQRLLYPDRRAFDGGRRGATIQAAQPDCHQHRIGHEHRDGRDVAIRRRNRKSGSGAKRVAKHGILPIQHAPGAFPTRSGNPWNQR
jgi:hypothetical protein